MRQQWKEAKVKDEAAENSRFHSNNYDWGF